MGSNMKPVIFNENVASALRRWHRTARKNIKENRQSKNATPFSSRSPTPLQGTSPMHLLQGYQNSPMDDSLRTSPRASDFDNEVGGAEGLPSSRHNIDGGGDSIGRKKKDHSDTDQEMQKPSTSRNSSPSQRPRRAQHEINISLSDFVFSEK